MMPRKGDLNKMQNEPPESAAASSNSSNLKGTKRKAEVEDGQGVEYLRRKHNSIKSTIRTDYQPDICKDYKETGFCGFGDSCKFLHDRSDYKHGWQMEQEWAKGQYADEDDDKYLIKDDEKDEEDAIPPDCVICDEQYKDPIMTKCKHYFCLECADKECATKCFTCEQPTSGIFKNASKVFKKTERKGSDHGDKCEANAERENDFDDLYD